MIFDPDWKERQDTPTTVVNLRSEQYDVYIGRPGKGQDGYFGNRHPIGWCSICNRTHDRDEAIAEFKKEFYNRIDNDAEFRARVISLRGKRLGCFCKPASCHGDIYKEWLDKNASL